MSDTADSVTIELPLLRLYLRTATPDSGTDILFDAFHRLEWGAVILLRFYLAMRANRRTRRSVQVVANIWRRTRRNPQSRTPLWYRSLLRHVMGLFRQWRLFAYPNLRRRADAALTEALPRSTRRHLSYTGAVQVELPTLKVQSAAAATQLWDHIRDRQVLVWLDNWYAERYTANPSRPVLSTNVTAFAVLVLEDTTTTTTVTTRSHRLPHFPGHLTLHMMSIRVDGVDAAVQRSLASLVTAAQSIALSRAGCGCHWTYTGLLDTHCSGDLGLCPTTGSQTTWNCCMSFKTSQFCSST